MEPTSAQTNTPAAPITLERLSISPGKLTAWVRLRPDARYTNPHLAHRVTADFPQLPLHACVNPHGPTFASVLEHTSLAHLLEHLIIDVQVAHTPDETAATFAGHTTWVSEADGLARITVSFRDDACALRALQEALQYVNGLDLGHTSANARTGPGGLAAPDA